MCKQLQLRMIFWGLIYLHCALRADYETQPAHNKTSFTQAVNFIKQQRRRTGKKRSIHQSIEQQSLPCVELQLNTEQPREASTIPGKIFITATNPQVSRTGEQDSVREQPSPVALISCSKPRFHSCGNPTNPHPCFSIVPAVFQAHKRDCRQKLAITIGVNLSSMSCQEERERASSPDTSSICQIGCVYVCVPLMWFHS